MLFDAASKLVQAYTYAAYGELLAIHNGLGASLGNSASSALTSMHYNGESFDGRIGQIYLRARWYDGHRFTTIDPYAGDASNPFSFKKYSFATGGDPILFADPTGMFEGLAGMIGSIAIRTQINMMPPGPGDLVQSAFESLMEAYAANLEWDVEWAIDMLMDDQLTSRSDEFWVQYAILRGIWKSYDDWLGQFTGESDNLGFEGGEAAATRPNRPKTDWRSSANSHYVSSRGAVADARGNLHNVRYYRRTDWNPPDMKIVVFDNPAKSVKISSPNRRLSNSKVDIERARTADIDAANLAHGKPKGYTWRDEFGGKNMAPYA